MKFGLRIPQTGSNVATKENIASLAKQAEDAGLYSLWVLERLIWPISPKDKYPGTADGRFPEDWQYIFDPIETLTFVASNTSKILVGTSVIDMLFHNPVILARRFATLDILSEGRSIAGCGLGWSKDEYEVSNITFEGRSKRADEYVQILKKIWTDDIIEFRGQFYNIPPSWIGPKPIQKPHVPIYLGGYSQKTFARIASYADGWICTIQDSLDQAKSNICKLEKECHKVNRDLNDINIAAILYPVIIDSADKRQGVNQGKTRKLMNGSLDQVVDDLLEISDIGVDQVILNYNRSPISNNIGAMVELTKKLWKFVG
jgi:probable F420-dependent oxidoreductase